MFQPLQLAIGVLRRAAFFPTLDRCARGSGREGAQGCLKLPGSIPLVHSAADFRCEWNFVVKLE